MSTSLYIYILIGFVKKACSSLGHITQTKIWIGTTEANILLFTSF